jgi:hypothetical protein
MSSSAADLWGHCGALHFSLAAVQFSIWPDDSAEEEF